MKIHVNADRPNKHIPYWVIQTLKKKGIYTDDPNADIIWNVDSIHNIGLVKGKVLTIYWEVDDFMALGRNDKWYSETDLLYIVHEQYKRHYPEKVKVLGGAADPDFHKDTNRKKEWDYVFVGSIEFLPVYYHRIQL